MASIVSNLSVGLRRITPKDRAAIKKEIDSFNMPGSYSYVLERVLSKKINGFVAFSKGQIIGFVFFSSQKPGSMKIDALYLRKGYERKGIGSKLLGNANSYAVKTKKNVVFLDAGIGVKQSNGKRELIESKGFYSKTNYRPVNEILIKRFRWWVKENSGKRSLTKKQQKPKMSLAPQNLLRKK